MASWLVILLLSPVSPNFKFTPDCSFFSGIQMDAPVFFLLHFISYLITYG
jgi:hypothetical protein